MSAAERDGGPDRDLDVVLYGATGFVGRLTAQYLAQNAPPGLAVGLAGRSQARLEAVRSSLGADAHAWPLIVADAAAPAALATLAARTRVVVTTVGPYLRFGLPLVEACATAGTHYCDLTGEVLFVRQTIDRFDAVAQATGARIVHSCGFDSVPSDLAVHELHRAVAADGAGELEDVTLQVVSMRGGFSGGTIDSLRAQIEAVAADRSLGRVVADPYALSPDRAAEPDLGDERDRNRVSRDRSGTWTGPFVMASYNTRIVRRSNALAHWAYGRRFRYQEQMAFGRSLLSPVLAGAVTAGLGAVAAGMSFAPTRRVLDRLLPAPGSGPDEKARQNGRFAMVVTGRTSTGATYVAKVAASGDPGYQATAVMLGESALSLALDELPPAAGVLTPAIALGSALSGRLRAAGFRLDVSRS